MSGYAGVVCADGETPDAKLLERMTERLAFRGPDATQFWIRPGAGFCFTLLRTGPAPQSNTQPCTVDGRVWLLGDVRLDGRDDLWRELEQAGESIQEAATDEELILRAWRQWGEQGLAKLLGDFSFALWDETAKQLWCLRDMTGARPFFYASSTDSLCFSNTLDVLRLFPGVSSALDRQFIGDFLINESSLDAWRTVYQDIRRLPPGHFLKHSRGELSVRRCAAFPIEEPLWLKRPADYVERFQCLLESAVVDRLPHNPSAIFLSGGLDSTSVAAVATRIAKRRGTPGLSLAFTADSRPLFDDQESTLASRVATELGLDVKVFFRSSYPPYHEWDAPLFRTPEPVHDPFFSLTRWLYRQVSAHARVAFSGYGGDDVLTGQAWPYLVYLLRHRRFRAIGKTFGGYLLKHRRIPPLRGGFRVRLLRRLGRTNPSLEFPAWLEPRLAKQYCLRDRCLELQRPPAIAHPLHPIAHTGLSSEVGSNMYELEDASWTDAPVELRAPLLDPRIMRFLLRIPPVPWCMEKELLRQAMNGSLPEEIRRRRKTSSPVDPIGWFVKSKVWSPLPLPNLAEEVREFVDCAKLRATLESAAGLYLWVTLRPISLHYWLKAIEN